MTSVYLGGIPKSVSERQLRLHLEVYGPVNAISITDKGFAFVEYEHEADARDIVNNFADKPFMGHDIKVELAKRPRRQTTATPKLSPVIPCDAESTSNDRSYVRFPVVVQNLNPRTCWQELKDFGRIAGGDPIYCDIDKTHRTRGFLEFYSQEAADDFVRMGNGRDLLGNVVELTGLGRRTLLPEHGPPSRSLTSSQGRRHSSRRVPSHSRSRSRSPVSSRRTDHSRSSRSPRHSPLLLPSVGRRGPGGHPRDRSDHYAYDRALDSQPRTDKRHNEYEYPYKEHDTSIYALRINTGYSVSDDYLDAYGERLPYNDRLETQWREYSDYPLDSRDPYY